MSKRGAWFIVAYLIGKYFFSTQSNFLVFQFSNSNFGHFTIALSLHRVIALPSAILED